MYPHERSLVKRLEGKPIVLLGVNSDPKNRLRKTVKKEKITWRSWWDGGNAGGPIARRWGIRGWPTLFLIDHKGDIRAKYVGSPGEAALNEAVDALVREMEGRKRST